MLLIEHLTLETRAVVMTAGTAAGMIITNGMTVALAVVEVRPVMVWLLKISITTS
jgi:hypothetical protein